jgi:3-phenylpropionate/trans-cinnamate dioxygenase ferredoxin reductase subunit
VSTIVIVGGTVAGGRAAETLRQQGFDGRIVLLGAEPERTYERPPLSKEYLLGQVVEEKLYLRPPAYYDEQGIDESTDLRALAKAPAAHPGALSS